MADGAIRPLASFGEGTGGINAPGGTIKNSKGVALFQPTYIVAAISAEIVSNSVGRSEGSGIGIYARVVNDSSGISMGSNDGINCTGTATNSFGESFGDPTDAGIRSYIATGCGGLRTGAVSRVVNFPYNMP